MFLLLFVVFLCDIFLQRSPSNVMCSESTLGGVPSSARYVTFIEVYDKITGNRLNTTLTDNGHVAAIVVQFSAFGNNFLLLLRHNRLMFSSSYVEKYFTQTEERRRQVSIVSEHCYYTGSVKSTQQMSTVAVSTCAGLKGYIVVQNESYHIEPAETVNDLTGRHYVFKQSDIILPSRKCGNGMILTNSLTQSFKTKAKRSLNWPQDLDGTTKVVEIYIVNSYSQYISQGSDVQKVTARTKEILNVVNSLYESQNIYFVLVGVEVWTSSDRISILANNVTKTLQNFLTYRNTSINSLHYNDNAQLITNVEFSGNIVGKASVGSMCSSRSSGGVNSDINSAAGAVGTSMAHEIGHNFGLVHDTEIPGCVCNDPVDNCIMYPMSTVGEAPTQWSSCSNSTFKSSMANGCDYCLKNIPATVFDSTSYCGNGMVESGEQCDCGQNPLSSQCNPACCNPTTCQLVGSAQCSSGRCCDVNRCQLRSQGYVCRPATGVCDISEYCIGTSPVCHSDVFVTDGTRCTVDGVSAFCYQGQCRSHQSQCQLLWGTSSAKSDDICYSTFNVKGDFAGYCAIDWKTMTYSPCSASDALCGQLLCWPTPKLVKFTTLFFQTNLAYIGSSQCNSVIVDTGTQPLLTSPGFVPNGAQCGDNKMCISQRCVDISSQNFPQTCTNDCNGNGVCSSAGKCQCNPGFDPSTNCTAPGGGSGSTGTTNASDSPSSRSSSTGLIVGLCVLFIVIIPLLIVASVCCFRHRQAIRSRFCAQKTSRLASGQQNVATIASWSAQNRLPSNLDHQEHDLKTDFVAVQPVRPSVPPPPKPSAATVRPPLPNKPITSVSYNVHENDSTTVDRLPTQPQVPRTRAVPPVKPAPPSKPVGTTAVADPRVILSPTRAAPPPPSHTTTR